MRDESELLDSLVALVAYGEKRLHVFPSKSSLTWFVRQHRTELVEHGALLMIAGRWFVSPHLFDAFILKAGKSAAARTTCDRTGQRSN